MGGPVALFLVCVRLADNHELKAQMLHLSLARS